MPANDPQAIAARLIEEVTQDGREIVGVWNIKSLHEDTLARCRQRHGREFVYARDYDALSAHVETLTQQVDALVAERDRLREVTHIARPDLQDRLAKAEQDNARLTAEIDRSRPIVADLTHRLGLMAEDRNAVLDQLVEARRQADSDKLQAEQQRDAAHAALRELAQKILDAEDQMTLVHLADAALAASAPQKE